MSNNKPVAAQSDCHLFIAQQTYTHFGIQKSTGISRNKLGVFNEKRDVRGRRGVFNIEGIQPYVDIVRKSDTKYKSRETPSTTKLSRGI